MPTNGIQFPPPPSGFRLAMPFDVTGNNVIAGGFGSNFCNNIASGFEFGFGGLATVVIPEEPVLIEAERGICCCSCLRTFIPISADKA
jgi:hypothetical protein